MFILVHFVDTMSFVLVKLIQDANWDRFCHGVLEGLVVLLCYDSNSYLNGRN